MARQDDERQDALQTVMAITDRRTLRSFMPKMPKKLTGCVPVPPAVPVALDYYFFYSPDDHCRNGNLAFSTAFSKSRNTDDNRKVCVNVANMLAVINWVLRSTLFDTLSQLGVRIREVHIPSQARANEICLSDVPELLWPEMLVLMGCCIIILFKTIPKSSYESFMAGRIQALKSRAGCDPSRERETPVPFSFDRAQAIRAMLGSSLELKRAIINFIIDSSRGRDNIAQICQYLAQILAYNEMDAFTLIYDTLLTSRSPVLSDPRLANEVLNLGEAIDLITGSEYPQFFCYLGDPVDLMKLEPCRFPILFAVAQRIQRESEATDHAVSYLASTCDLESPLVTKLLNIHIRALHVHTERALAASKTIDSLRP